MVSQVALVVSGPLVVRMLGVSDRGQLALVFAVVLLVSQVGVAGVPGAVSWFVASRGLDAARFLARLQRRFVGQVVVCTVLAATAVVLLDLLGHPLTQPWLLAVVAGLGVGAVMAAMLGMAALQGQQRFTVLARLQPVPAVTYAVAAAVLLGTGGGSVGLLLAINLAGWAVVAVVSLWLVGRVRGVGDEWPAAGDVRSYARSAMVTTAAPIDTLGIEQLIVGLVAGHYLLGLFTVGWAFETGPVVLLVALASFVGPRVSVLPAAQRATFARRWLLVAAGLGVAACLAIQLVLAPVLVLAFGAEAEPAVPLARVLVVAGVVLGLRRVTSALLVGLGEARAATWCELAGFFTMVLGMGLAALPYMPITMFGWALVLGGAVTLLGQVLVLARSSSGASASA